MDATTVYVLAKQGLKVSHNTRVEWFIGNVNKKIQFKEPGVCGEFVDESPEFSDDERDTCETKDETKDEAIHSQSNPVDWKSLSVVAVSSNSPLINYPISYFMRPQTTIKFLAHAYSLTFVIDLSESMLQPSSSGFCPLHHAVTSIEATLENLIPQTNNIGLPLHGSRLDPLYIFVSIIGVVPGRQSYTIIQDWEAVQSDLKSVLNYTSRKLFLLEASEKLTKQTGDNKSALIEMLRHGVLTLAMQKPEWAPSSLIIISDGCFDTADMVELDRSLSHLRAASIRCSFIILTSCNYQESLSDSESFDESTKYAPQGLLLALSTGACITHYDLCQFIAHATAGFCVANPSIDWNALKISQPNGEWNKMHEVFLALKLQDDANSSPLKEGDLGWMPFEEIKPHSRIVHAAMTHVLASRLKDGYRLRSASVSTSELLPQSDGENNLGSQSDATMNKLIFQNNIPKRYPWVQLELVLAWKPGVVFRYFLAGEWVLPIGRLPIVQSDEYLPPNSTLTTIINGRLKPQLSRNCGISVLETHGVAPFVNNKTSQTARFCVTNLKVFANYSFLHEVTSEFPNTVHNAYRVSVFQRFSFHFRLLNHVDNYLEKVSSFNLDPSIYRVPTRYINGLSPVFLTVQGLGGQLEMNLAGNLTAEDVPRDIRFADYWGNLLTLDISNCYRWMHMDTIYILLEHDSPLPPNLFIPIHSKGVRGTNSITFRQSLSRIHSVFCEWCSFVLLENHTYIRLEYPPHNESMSNSNPDLTNDVHTKTVFDQEFANHSIPSHFTLVRLEMKLPEIRVRIAFAAGIQSDLRRVTIENLSERLRKLSFLARGKQTVPKSRHKSGNVHNRLPHLKNQFMSSDNKSHVPPLQRTWAETPCCRVFQSRLDRLIVENGTWVCPTSNCARSILNQSSFRWMRCGQVKRSLAEVSCDVAPSLLRQHLCNSGHIWVIPLVSKSTSCLLKMFFTLVNLRIQEGFHFVRVGPQPGFVSLAREILFATDSHNAETQSCLVQYQIYPFRQKSRRGNSTKAKEETVEMKKACDAVQKVLDVSRMHGTFSKVTINKIKALTSSRLSSEIHIATEVWIEPKHGSAVGLPQEADYLSHLSYKQLVSRMFQLDAACLSAYFTLESLLTSCLLKIIELQRRSLMHDKSDKLTPQAAESTYPIPAFGVAGPVSFNLINLIAVAPQICLLYPLLFEPSFMPQTPTAIQYLAKETVINRLGLNLLHRMPYVTSTPMTQMDSNAFNQYIIVSEKNPENRAKLSLALKDNEVTWHLYASVISLQHSSEIVPDKLEKSSGEINSSTVIFFILPESFSSATSKFIQALTLTLRQESGETHVDATFPIFVFACTHTYLSFLLDDRWTYKRPPGVIVDFFHRVNKESKKAEPGASSFVARDALLTCPPATFLEAAKGNQRLTQELTLLWRSLKETTMVLSVLCDEAFVECAHRTLIHGFFVSERALKTVLVSEQFCTSMPPIKIDATNFLFATCSHCFFGIQTSRKDLEQNPLLSADNEVNEDETEDIFRCSFIHLTSQVNECELRPNDHSRLQKRISNVFQRFFSPVPQFPGYFFFRSTSDLTGMSAWMQTRCEASQIPVPKVQPVDVTATNVIPVTVTKPSPVIFSTSFRSESDSDRRDESELEEKSQTKSCSSIGSQSPTKMDDFLQPMPHLLPTKPLFLKILALIQYQGVDIRQLSIEDFPFCLLDIWPEAAEKNIDIRQLRLEISFIPLVWKPKCVSVLGDDSNVGEMAQNNTTGCLESTENGEDLCLVPEEDLEEEEQEEEEEDEEDDCDDDDEANDEESNSEVDSNSLCYSMLHEDEKYINIKNYNLKHRRNSVIRFIAKQQSLECDDDKNKTYFSNYWCDCSIYKSLSDSVNIFCPICSILCSFDMLRCLNNDQWTAIQRTVIMFRWMLQDEIVCSLRLLQPVSPHTLAFVLRHMENTKLLLLNSVPSVLNNSNLFNSKQTAASGPSYPFTIDHALAKLSKPCILARPRIKRENDSNIASATTSKHPMSDSLWSMTSGIGWDSVSLSFVVHNEKALLRFFERLESISFRYTQGRLEKLDNFYFVCNSMLYESINLSNCPLLPFPRDLKIRGAHIRKPFFGRLHALNELARSSSDSKIFEEDHSCHRTCFLSTSAINICTTCSNSSMAFVPHHTSVAPIHQQNNERDSSDDFTSVESKTPGHGSSASFNKASTWNDAHQSDDDSEGNSSSSASSGSSVNLKPSSFPLHDETKLITRERSFNMPPYWLIFRVGSSSVSIYFHHSDTHCEYLVDSNRTCQHCIVFRRAISDLKTAVHVVNQSLLLDQLGIERICDPALVPEDQDEQPTPKILTIEAAVNRHKNNRKRFVSRKLLRSPEPAYSTTSATDSDTAEVNHGSSKRSFLNNIGCTRQKMSPENVILQKSTHSAGHQIKPDIYDPGTFICPIKCVISIKVHPRATSCGDRGRQVLPELRRLLENIAVLNRNNMFVLIDGPESRDATTVVSTTLSSSVRHNSAPSTQPLHTLSYADTHLFSTAIPTVGSKMRASVMSNYTQNRIFYMLLKESTVDSPQENVQFAGFEQQLLSKKCPIARRESLPSDLAFSGLTNSPVALYPSGIRVLLHVTLHGIAAPSRQLCTSVRQLLQSLLDKIVLEHLCQALSRNALSRLTIYDFDFFFNRKPEQPHQRILLNLPEFLSSSMLVPSGSLALSFCQYLKQNLLLFLTPAKPERDLISCLRFSLGCGEILFYNRTRGLGIAKSGVATVIVNILLASQQGTEPYTITSFVGPHDWFHLQLDKTKLSSSSNFSLNQLLTYLDDINETPRDMNQPHRLAVSFRLWERGDADMIHLVSRLKSAVQHAVFDLLTEYFVLTQSSCAIETPIFKERSSSSPSPIIEIESSTAKHHGCTDTSIKVNYIVTPNIVNISPYILNTLIPWMDIARNIETPLVTSKCFRLISDRSINLLVSELLCQLNLLVEETNKPFSVSSHLAKCPVLQAMSVAFNSSPKACETSQRGFTTRSLSGSPQPACACQRSIHFFAFQQKQNGKGQWSRFSTPMSPIEPICPGQRREFVLMGRNYSICLYQAAMDRLLHETKLSSSDLDVSEPTFSQIMIAPVKPIATWPGRVPIQRHQPLDIQVQVSVSTAIHMEPSNETKSEKTSSKHSHEHRDASLDSRNKSSSKNADSPSESFSAAHSHNSLNALCDIPEFCDIQLRLPPDVLNIHRDAEITSAGKDSMLVSQSACLNVPRQAVCMVHIKGRHLTVYAYNWQRDEVDRLLQRVDDLITWYNQRFRVLECLSWQKMGLFHNLCSSPYLPLLHRASELGHLMCPPELKKSGLDANLPASSQQPPSSATPTSPSGDQSTASMGSNNTMSLTGKVTHPIGIPSTSRRNAIMSSRHHRFHLPIDAPFIDKAYQYTRHHHPDDPPQTSIHRLYQDCAKVSSLKPLENSHLIPVDLVHEHILQAHETISNDRRRAHQLHLITTPLRLWLNKSHGGESFSSETLGSPESSFSFDLETNDSMESPLKYFSAVKQFSRTLHTICAPILFCPVARGEEIRLRRSEQLAESKYAQLVVMENSGAVSDVTSSTNSSSFNDTPSNEILQASTALPMETGPHVSSVPASRRSKPGFHLGEAGAEVTKSIDKLDFSPISQFYGTSHIGSLDRSASHALEHSSSSQQMSPAWMVDAENTLLEEYINYITTQVHFSVISSSLNTDENNRSKQPYALLQRSIKMTGIHLIEIFIHDSLLCVRLKAVELCRFFRRTSRALLTGPLANQLLGRAAAAAVACMTSAMIEADVNRNSGAGVHLHSHGLPSASLKTTRPMIGRRSPSSSSSSSFLRFAGSQQLRLGLETGLTKWEESSRLCDCTHLHSFLYDFHLRHVDAFLRHQSERNSHRLARHRGTGLGHSRTRMDITHQSHGSIQGMQSASTSFVLPNGFPVIDFLCDMDSIARSTPMFARGTFSRLNLSISVGDRIKPEQVFDHLIQEGQLYSIKAFNMGSSEKNPSSLPNHRRFGLCEFTDSKFQKLQPKQHAHQYKQQQQLQRNPYHHHQLHTLNRNRGIITTTTLTMSNLSSQNSDGSSGSPSISPAFSEDNVLGEIMCDSMGEGGSSNYLPRIQLPTAGLFNVACAAFFDRTVRNNSKKNSSSNCMNISVFIILTDPRKRFPRARLTSLPQGLPSNHTTPVQWPAIRPSFSYHNDLSCVPSLHRCGSQETTVSSGLTGQSSQFRLSREPRCRHASLMIRSKVEKEADEVLMIAKERGSSIYDQHSNMNLCDLSSCGPLTRRQKQQPSVNDPGLRWKISYLGVWPSHQFSLTRAVGEIAAAWRASLPPVVNLAILNCHKNLLWYRMFDSRYFPSRTTSMVVELLSAETGSSLTEQGEDVAAVDDSEVHLEEIAERKNERKINDQLIHKGLSLEELQDLIESALVHIDLLRMDRRLVDLLKVGGRHLAKIVEHINNAWFDGSTFKPIAFLYPSVETTSSNEGECRLVHMGLILPSFHEGFVLLKWRELTTASPKASLMIQPPCKTSLSKSFRLLHLNPPIQGIAVTEPKSSKRCCFDFELKAIYRSSNSMDLPTSVRRSSTTITSTTMQELNYQKSPLQPVVKLLVEHLTYFVWRDLHLGVFL